LTCVNSQCFHTSVYYHDFQYFPHASHFNVYR
jgi:hypothetical protein